jgi:hypothetical protein
MGALVFAVIFPGEAILYSQVTVAWRPIGVLDRWGCIFEH